MSDNPVKLLTDDALREIEARRACLGEKVWYHVPLTPTERDALCATVRALRFRLAQAEQAFELESAVRPPEVGNLNVLQIVKKMAELHESNTALREQLAELQERERALLAVNAELIDGNSAAHAALDEAQIKREDVVWEGPIQHVTEYPVCGRIGFLRQQLVEVQAGYQRATIGLSNLYHVITNERCDDAVALGMATSAVGVLVHERDQLQSQLAQVTQERDELRQQAPRCLTCGVVIAGHCTTCMRDWES